MNKANHKRTSSFLSALVVGGLLLASGLANAAGLMKPKNSPLPDLQIREHHVNVVIENGYATTSIEQLFHNPNTQELEAIYSFPVPEKAAVGEFIYWIDGKPITAEVIEKEQAREIYTQEKQAGRETALVEKDQYKTFDISVYPVRANSDVRVRLVYIQAAHVDHSIGRYVYPLEDGGVDDQKLSFWSRNEVVSEKFSFNLDLRSGYPLDSVRLPQHPQAQIQNANAQEWTIQLGNNAGFTAASAMDSTEKSQMKSATEVETEMQTSLENELPQTLANTNTIRLDKDIVVYWRLEENLPGALDLVTYREDQQTQGTFMLTLTPGNDLPVIQNGSDWVFVLDISGSMQGKYATLIEGVRQGLNKLQAHDRFRVITFNQSARDISKGYLAATPENVNQVLTSLTNIQPNHGTNLYAGLDSGIKKLDADRSTALILVTDGVANVGVTEKKEFIKLLKQSDVRLFTFIMGNSANRPLLEEMTNVSQGFAVSVSNADDVIGKIMEATSKMTHASLRDIQLDINGVRVSDITPKTIGSLYRGEQLIVFGHYMNPGQARVSLSGKVGDETRQYKTTINLPAVNTDNPELERLWAYGYIEHLQSEMDYYGADSDTEQAITDIATQYGLVTNYTSMLVVREEVFQQHNISRNNQARVAKEHQARNQRQQQPTQSTRADQHEPMFQKPRSTTTNGRSGGGGGSVDIWVLLAMLPLLAVSIRRKRQLHLK